MKIFVKTLGCRANRYESEKLIDKLCSMGHSFVSDPCEADTVIVNTCTVTHTADRKSRQEFYPFLKSDKKVIVFGCGPRVAREHFEKIEGIDFIAKEPAEIIKHLGKTNVKPESCDLFVTRSNLKIQDGCENFCTYCIVPFARGKCKSKPYKDVLREAAELADKGAKEIVLTGINIGEWKDGKLDFWDLAKELLNRFDFRIRISSLEPFLFDEKTADVLKHKNFCQHLHICAQSGSDSVLKGMGRHYKAADFKKLISKIRDVAPDIAITTDIITGFPGETEFEYQETLRFISDIEFAKVHTFKYSKREGTPAAKAKGQVPYSIKAKRASQIRKLSADLRKKYLGKFIGSDMEVLFERQKNGVFTGTTRNYIKVKLKSSEDLTNKIKIVKVQVAS